MMKIGFVGLGKMGFSMVENIIDHGHEVVAYDVNEKAVEAIAKKGAVGVSSLKELVDGLPKEKVVWLMIPHQFVDDTLTKLTPLLSKGDIVIDGGNSFYKESMRRAKELDEKGLVFMDIGTSGGIKGARNGACMMIGGPKTAFEKLEKIFDDMTTDEGYFYCGPAGAGHFVKMVHNGIEYGIMEAYAEGFELLAKNKDLTDLDLKGVSSVWNHGSIIQSYLLEKIEGALEKDPKLEKIRGDVSDSGEGRWTIQTAIECGVDVPVLAQSLFTRFRSRKSDPFSDRLLAAMRREFGGHAVKEK